MKKLILLLLITNLSFSQQWTKTEINNLLSIDFPNTPKKGKGFEKVYFSTSHNKNNYKITVRESKRLNISESSSESELIEFYKTYTNGSVSGMNGKIIKHKKILINGIIGNETTFLKKSNIRNKILTFRRTFLLEDKLIFYEFTPTIGNKKGSEKLKNKFFNSLNINS
jgi:hypothetical protein